MKIVWAIISIIATSIGFLAVFVSDVIGMPSGMEIPEDIQIWGLSLFMFGVGLPTILNQVEKFLVSKIHLVHYGIQPDKALNVRVSQKKLFRNKEEIVRVEFPAFYLELQNKPMGNRSIEGVMPYFFWFDESGKLVARNPGRWWLSNVSTYQDTAVLQTVNLDPNGQTRVLHFARVINGELHAWFRTQDNKEPACPLPEGNYYVRAIFQSNSGSSVKYDFSVKYSSHNIVLKRLKGLNLFWKRTFRGRRFKKIYLGNS